MFSPPPHIAIDIWPAQQQVPSAPVLQKGSLRSPLPVQYDLEAKPAPPLSPGQQLVATLTSWFFGSKK